MLKRLVLLFLLVTATLTPVKAALINQLVSYSAGTSSPLDSLVVNPFDTSLGTLDEVRVSIDGQIVISGTGRGLTAYDLRLGLDLHGFAGQFFDFNDPGLEFIYQGTLPYATCAPGGCVPASGPLLIPTTTFNLDFSFNRVFEELGVNQGFIDGFSMGGATGASPPAVISGSVSDFHDTLFGLDQMELLLIPLAQSNIISFNMDLGGTMAITYDYTPSQIPIPAAFWLFGTALVGLIGFRKRRQAA